MDDRLQLLGIEKRFGGVAALRGAELSARAGEVLGLCGENGAGKSTLLKVLGGIYPHGSFRGEVRVDGQALHLRGPQDARRAGIAVVHQELMLVPGMTVAENLLLGREPRATWLPFLVDPVAAEAQARALLDRYPFCAGLDPGARVAALGTGERQLVEIARALSLDARILVLDEPTAALTEAEAERLHGVLRGLRAAGTTCVYVSHRLDEVFALCDRVTVLRDGRTVGTVAVPADGASIQHVQAEVVAMMVGRSIEARGPAPRREAGGPPALEVFDLSLRLPGGPRPFAVTGVSLTVQPGEVVALCGAMGAGRTALLSAIFGAVRGAGPGGARDRVSGAVRVGGAPVRADHPRAAIDAGLALLPEDRKGQGLVLGMSIADNLSLPEVGRGAGPLGLLAPFDVAGHERDAAERVRRLGVRVLSNDTATPVGHLSGGNQQKVALGKWLAKTSAPRVLLLDEPTRGVDIGAREEIYALIESLCQAGAGVLMASSDLAEVLRLAHRVLVLRDGRVVGALPAPGAALTREEIVRLSTGAGAAA